MWIEFYVFLELGYWVVVGKDFVDMLVVVVDFLLLWFGFVMGVGGDDVFVGIFWVEVDVFYFFYWYVVLV